jgi:hypothetical protein
MVGKGLPAADLIGEIFKEALARDEFTTHASKNERAKPKIAELTQNALPRVL